MAWGFLIAMYFFLAGTGAGAFLTAVVAERYDKVAFRPLIRAGLILSGILVGLGMPFLIADLGAGRSEPWRLILLITNLGSPMTWGVWVLTPFIPLALVLGWLEVDFLSPPWRIVAWARGLAIRWRTRLLQVGALLAIAIAIYTGVLLGVVRAVPLWNSFILPMVFFVSAMSTGLAACVVLSQVSLLREPNPLGFDHVGDCLHPLLALDRGQRLCDGSSERRDVALWPLQRLLLDRHCLDWHPRTHAHLSV
jgi:polysulfide reductase chain C